LHNYKHTHALIITGTGDKLFKLIKINEVEPPKYGFW